ncbi:hypothetical protein AGMMS49944_03990 [Spirochaetia bacterium]|nr:hypothetical protein AGMMS49944_03990 [Spirochaetia bacterium]
MGRTNERSTGQDFECTGRDEWRRRDGHFTNYYGTQLLDDGFAEHLVEEGVLEEEPEEDEDEEGVK